MLDFNKYLTLQDCSLKHIEYQLINKNDLPEKASLNCKDKLEILSSNDEKVNFILTRKLYFEPSYLYEINVSVVFSFAFNQNTKSEVDWEKVNLIEELKNDNNIVLGNIISRISLLISEITSFNSFIPVITPPTFMS